MRKIIVDISSARKSINPGLSAFCEALAAQSRAQNGATKMTTKKISDWLEEHIGSHDIDEATALAKSFNEETGGDPSGWPTHTVKETRDRIANDPRGGSISGKNEVRCVYGYELASHLAWKHTKKSSHAMGRGFAYRENVQLLRDAGL